MTGLSNVAFVPPPQLFSLLRVSDSHFLLLKAKLSALFLSVSDLYNL